MAKNSRHSLVSLQLCLSELFFWTGRVTVRIYPIFESSISVAAHGVWNFFSCQMSKYGRKKTHKTAANFRNHRRWIVWISCFYCRDVQKQCFLELKFVLQILQFAWSELPVQILPRIIHHLNFCKEKFFFLKLYKWKTAFSKFFIYK